ncbi:hypothetical protein QFC22_001266 [Naganishia vaughanmartiniae]|uniref:Uncharacterized protein n=1 Tax=Naganishia vaughanmartiniae TaxID=1424756 RepID=A0ACC2XK24_9TREE|nr:hypothetical protein QFC22_001266 [Naganishia vaughanmartiniae]
MSNSGTPKTSTSLRSIRSRVNPNVTLYSLAETKPLVGPSDVDQQQQSTVNNDFSIDPVPTESRFFSESSAAAKRSATSTLTRKRRKIEVQDGRQMENQAGKSTVRSRSSSPSSVSSSRLSEDPTYTDAINVKLEAIATPRRRNLRRQTGIPTTPAVATTPAEVVKEELSTPLRQVATLKRKNESATKPQPSTPIKLKLEKAHAEPPKWKRQYELISKMRERIVAPVDTMGCDTPNGERSSDPKTVRFHILISLMLSSQTKDPVTSQAVTNLNDILPGGLTAQSLASALPEVVAECINKVGFWRRKTEYIQDAARRIVEGGLDDGEVKTEDVEGIQEESGDIPRTLNGLVKLRGVGPKMAFLALQCAWNINAGIGVDVHVHRITNRLGWHKPKTTEPEQTRSVVRLVMSVNTSAQRYHILLRLNLESWLPPHLFKPINHVLVGFGQVVCLPVGPRCDVCLLGIERLCPSRVANVNNVKGRKVVDFGFSDVEDVKSGIDVKLEDEPPLREIDADVKPELLGGTTSRVKIEVEPDSVLRIGAQSDTKPLLDSDRSESRDAIEKLVEEPGMLEPEIVVGVVADEIAQMDAVDLAVVKTE